MIDDVDASLGAMMKADVLTAGEADVVFDAPTTGWAAKRAGPVIDAFLYDIREDTERRKSQPEPERDERGRITGLRRLSRHFKMSYLLSAWTTRPEDEHRLLGRTLEMLLRYDRIPEQHLRGRLRGQNITMTLALPPASDRSLSVSDVWGALGGKLKPSLDLVLVVPIEPDRLHPVGPPLETPPMLVTSGLPREEVKQ